MGRELIVAICLDDGGGMLFGGQRQSRDRVLTAELCASTNGKIYITSFSSAIFKEHRERVEIVDDPFNDAPDGATLFIENIDISPDEDRVAEILLYKWNRKYPADKWIDIDLSSYRIISKRIFVGSSHDKITRLKLKRET